MKFKQQLPIVWLVGGSGKLGLSIAKELELKYNLVNLSRQQVKDDFEYFLNVKLNLADIPHVQVEVDRLLELHSPRAVVFCQRYRPLSESDDIDTLSAVNTEIISTQCIIESIISKKVKQKCSVVIISSLNGKFVNKELPFWYHWLKSSQMSIVKYYAVNNGDLALNINCISAGSFVKYSIKTYPVERRNWMEKLSQLSPMKRNTRVQDISDLVKILISDQTKMINGQIIAIDGGITNIYQETLI